MTEIEEDRIRMRAYEIWEAMGCPEGRHQETWQQAQIEIAAQDAYGLKAESIRTMQSSAVGNSAAPGATVQSDQCPPTLQQLRDCMND